MDRSGDGVPIRQDVFSGGKNKMPDAGQQVKAERRPLRAIPPLMTHEQFAREMEFQLMMYFAKRLRRKGEITEGAFRELRDSFMKACDPPIGKLNPPKCPEVDRPRGQ